MRRPAMPRITSLEQLRPFLPADLSGLSSVERLQAHQNILESQATEVISSLLAQMSSDEPTMVNKTVICKIVDEICAIYLLKRVKDRFEGEFKAQYGRKLHSFDYNRRQHVIEFTLIG